jgi:hypothetical protein
MREDNVMSNEQETEKTPEKKWFITPELEPIVDNFCDLYKFLFNKNTHQKTNILLEGETGAGKSLFRDLFETLYREDYPEVGNGRIHMANCAHFGGKNSDPNIARSELFGITKEFTPHLGMKNRKDNPSKETQEDKTSKGKPGLIGEADNGLLILEEIGDLPLEVQAILLTFIETGEYRQVGGTKKEHANTHIIGATNKANELRNDFYYRFFPFYVPGLHERRDDILYMIADRAPDLIRELRSFDVFALLCYNWPGNVRELETKIDVIMWQDLFSDFFKKIKQSKKPDDFINTPLMKLSKPGTNYFYSFINLVEYVNSVDLNDPKSRKIEKDLNRFGLSLDFTQKEKPFKRFKGLSYDEYKEIPESHMHRKFITVKTESLFEMAYKGMGKIFTDDELVSNEFLLNLLVQRINSDHLPTDSTQAVKSLCESTFSFKKEELLLAYYKVILPQKCRHTHAAFFSQFSS